MLNLALALQSKGYDVCIYTPRYDPAHAFQELKDGKVRVEVHGSFFPRHIFNRFNAFCAYVRMLLCALYIIFFKSRFQLVVLDQVPLPIPFLRVFTRAKVLFYCHHPDKLLCTERRSFIKRVYRFFIDNVEEQTMAMAHAIVVNSIYTRDVFYRSFPTMARNRRACLCCCKAPKATVLYPAIERSAFDVRPSKELSLKEVLTLDEEQASLGDNLNIVCTLNRYERKKNLGLAIEAFGHYLNGATEEAKRRAILVVAGGYDNVVRENVEHFKELTALTEARAVPAQNIRFLRSISNEARALILKHSKVLLYTPANEHFGIVPLEAMYNNCVVIACNSGGPLETVEEGTTGYLLEPRAETWGDKIGELLADEGRMARMGEAGKKHVIDKFTNEAFADQLNDIVKTMLGLPKRE